MTEQIDNKTEDIITREPEKEMNKKNPRKVAAGKKLAEYNKKHKRSKALKENENNDEVEETNTSWVPEMSIGTALSLVGISLTAVDLYFRWYRTKPTTTDTKPKMENTNDQEVMEKPKLHIPVPATPRGNVGME